MKLAYLCFDDMITVPSARRIGEDTTADACESTFRAVDGWQLDEVTPGVFTLRSDCMAVPMTVGGHGYRYIPEVSEPAPDFVMRVNPEAPKGKRR